MVAGLLNINILEEVCSM